MKFKVKTLERLLIEATQKADKSLNFADLRDMTEDINRLVRKDKSRGVTFGDKYIYDNIYRKFNKMDEEEDLNLNPKYVDTIARFAGYDNFREFEKSLTSIPIDTEGNTELIEDLIERCGGVWWSYVRSNSGQPELLVAPMRIFQEKGKVIIQMKGGSNIYQSDLTMKSNCLRCLLDGGNRGVTQIYMVMKLASAPQPMVLLGIFGGMSQGGMPIGGREVWVRETDQNACFEDLVHQRLDMEEDKDKIHRNILHYFKDRKQNCWKGTLPSSFDMRDLRND